MSHLRIVRNLVERNEGDRRIRVVEMQSDGSRLYFDGAALYTHVDSKGNNCLEYVAAMDRALGDVVSVLMLGTAGGALATLLSRRGVAVTAVDNWQPAFEIARRWFHLPAEVDCVTADALEFLKQTGGRWDAVAVDVFHGVEIPEAFLTSDIGALLARVVQPAGMIIWNVADSPSSWPARWIAKALRLEGFSPTLEAVLDCEVGNTLVVCRNTPAEGAEAPDVRQRRRKELELFSFP